MINTLFYFADTEAEYLANVQNVASHTVVFCKDTNTIWKDGRKYGGDNTVVRIDEEASSVSYAINDSSTEHPTNETDWVAERPAGEQGRYLWTRDITAYTDGTHTITYGVVYFPLDGAGTAIDKNNTFVRYSNQKTQQRPAAESFTLSEPPSLEIGDWLWVLNRVTYEGGTPLDSYSVSRVGSDGAQGDPGSDGYTTHFAYSTSADGKNNFSTTNFSGASYIGTCRDNNENDPLTPESYVWTKWKGDNGQNGVSSYIHVKYSNDAGRTFTANNGETPGYYMGQCVDNNVSAPNTPSSYTWALIKGEDGKEGTGINIKGAVENVNQLPSSGVVAGDAYMVSADLYVWTGSEWKNVGRIKGEKGDSQYIHVAWSTSSDGSENFAVVKKTGVAYTYMGMCVDSNSDDPQTYLSYVWTLVKGDKGDLGLQGPQGPKGEDGLNGKDGVDGAPGTSTYFHVAYANKNASGSIVDFSLDDPTDREYIGTYVDSTYTDSTSPAAYTWMLAKGAQGPTGEQGIPGNDGADGRTSYLHIKYSNDLGKTFTANNGETPGYYLGQYVDFTAADSSNPSAYKWALIKGLDGTDGKDGTGVNIKGSVDSASQLPTSGISAGDAYMVDKDLYVYTGSSWKNVGQIKGEDGRDGTNGVDGKSAYLHIAYATSSNGTNFSTTHFSGATYIGVYTDSYVEDSENWQDYVWSLIKGEKGDKGDKGDDGLNGKDGVDGAPGTSSYFHVAYANKNASGTITDFSVDNPKDREYIGTYVDQTQADSTDPSKYTWMLAKGAQGENGEQGVPGQDGVDGKTSYLHIKYSNDLGKTFTTNNGETPGYYLGQYVDFTQADSSDPSKYKWALIKGVDGTDGKDGTGVTIKGSVDSASQLPSSGASAGDAYMVDKDLYIWTGSQWKNVGQIKGNDGKDGTNGINGTSAYLHIAYATSADGKQNFSTTSFTGATYIGICTDSSQADPETPSSYVWSLFKGEKGDKGDSITINTTASKVEYAIGNSGAVAPNSGWSTTIPSAQQGKYLWTRDTTVYSDGKSTVTYGVSYYGIDGTNGTNGTSVTVDSNNTYVRYSTVTNSSVQPADSTFSLTTPPTLVQGSYLWILSRTTYSDGTSLKSYSVSRMGTDGDNGDPGADGYTTHFAYATSADGKTGFSTTNFNGATYIGTCRDKNEADPTTPGSYVWTRWKGDKGDDGSVFAYINENGLILESGSEDNLTEFNLSKDGLLQLRNAIIYGELYSSKGTIGGLTLSGNSLYNGMTSLTDTTNNGIWLGTSGIALGKGAFKVTNDGSLTATRGTIGGFNIESTRLYSEDGAEIRLGSTASNWLSLSPSGILFSKRSGSAVNLTNALNANGSGSLASGNITWDASGNTKITGEITATKITLGTNATISAGKVTGLSDVATAGTFASLKEKPVIATKVSDLTNDSGFVDSSSLTTTLSSYATTTALNNGLSGKVATSDFTQANIIKKINNSDTSTTIDGGKITAGTISANQIATNAVTADKIAANAITADKIAANTITASKINTTGLIAEGAEVFVNTGGSLSPSQMNGVSVKLNEEGVVVANIANSTSTVTNALYSDGSGKLASGNIVWDASGNISKLKTVQGHYSSTFENGSATFTDDRMLAATIAIQGGTLTASDTTNGSSTVTISSDTVSASSGQITLSGNYTGKTTINGSGVHVYNGSTLKANISTEDGTATLGRIKLGNADVSYDSNRQAVFCDYGLATDGDVEAQGDLHAEGELSVEGTSTFRDTITAELGIYVSGTLAINGGVSVTSGNTTKTGVTRSFKIKATGTYQGTSSDYDLTLTFTNGILTGYSTNGFPGETA